MYDICKSVFKIAFRICIIFAKLLSVSTVSTVILAHLRIDFRAVILTRTWGERRGEEGAGEEDETPESPAAAAIEVARWGSSPYLTYFFYLKKIKKK